MSAQPRYFVGPNGYGDECLWRRGDDPDRPEVVAHRPQLDASDPALWPALVDRLTRPRPLATRAEVAEYLGVPATTLTQWAHKGTGPRYTRVGRHARYRWSDVEEWLGEQHVGGGVR